MPTAYTDDLAELLARVATASAVRPSDEARERLKTIVIDSFAVALAALKHPAALAVRRYAATLAMPDAPCAIWGTSRHTGAEAAALANGVLLRCHDYNDLYIGRRSWGHPSDVIAALMAVAERQQSSGAEFLEALAVGYEVTLALFDTLPAAAVGWDYSNLTAISATCAIARLSGLSEEQTREALAIAVIPHFASDEIESGDLNRRGDLTMWKRFNAGDAMRQAVYACDLARVGVEGAVRPFEGKLGFLKKLGVSENPAGDLRERLGDELRLERVDKVTLKRWPVGSRAQHAIAVALDLRQQIESVDEVAKIEVRTTEAVFEHLVRSRPAPWAPVSRETADHSLPYIVASAVLDGRIGTDSFSPERVLEPRRRAFVQKVEVTPDLDVAAGDTARAFAARIEIVMLEGRRIAEPNHGAITPAAGLNREAIERKFIESSTGRITAAAAKEALGILHALERCPDMRQLSRSLVVEDAAALDRDPEI